MNNITVSLDIAKKLKEAGWDQDCHFSYVDNSLKDYPPQPMCLNHLSIVENGFAGHGGHKTYFAPTAEEILRELPCQIQGLPLEISKTLGSGCTIWQVSYGNTNTESTSLAEAVGDMWLHLKSNNLLPFTNKKNEY